MGKMMLREFYEGKRVFVTGHTGFKGAWLTLWLARMGAKVTGYSLDPPSTPSLFELAQIKQDARWIRADLMDAEEISNAVAEAKPDIVVHMAAQSLVGEGYREPARTFAVNVQGTVNLLDALRPAGGEPVVVVVTSDKCYAPRPDGKGHLETDRLGGHDPYSASKSCAEFVAAAYRASFFRKDGPKVATVRAGNVIGGGDFGLNRIIPDAVRALQKNTQLKVRYPGAVRPWQYVLDSLAGYLLLAQKMADNAELSRAWNFGPDTENPVSVASLLQAFERSYGQPLECDTSLAAYAENPSLVLDSTAARHHLGWNPVFDFDAMIRATAVWYERVLAGGENARAVSLTMLDEYERAMGEVE